MKTLKTLKGLNAPGLRQYARSLFTVLALVPALMAAAQNGQPDKSPDNHFPQNLPASAHFDINKSTLDQLFHSDGPINIAMSPSFQLKGNVENKDLDTAGDGSLLIRTESFDGAMLSLARFTDADRSVHYTGHLLKLHAPEGMLLVEKDHNYYFIRTQQRYLLAE